MTAPLPVPELSLAISPSSSAAQGGDLFDMGGFDADFGKSTGGSKGGSLAANASPISGFVRDIAIGLTVAIAAKYLWSAIK